MSTTASHYAEILASAPSYDAMLTAMRTVLATIEQEYHYLIQAARKHDACPETLRSHMNIIRQRLYAAENILDCSTIIEDFKDAFPLQKPAPTAEESPF